ncbi:uncharacterized protein SOCG_01078 [Schizosaccharomyces octosporus yFS286]|uniref:Uncharacterized protein n=1 Tax=Schizosaccharomyces octosporus (strain yFS286) TaxID=483514 RepID=S9PZC9_SCHOY|nr:uncharacterized protein SOCG_01078 [Schizosaccharomyces octosporus yFS286]EPX73327.1 hypothetical protein SOCG_01078 [Schizosaccharomyces octosporus yFS286]
MLFARSFLQSLLAVAFFALPSLADPSSSSSITVSDSADISSSTSASPTAPATTTVYLVRTVDSQNSPLAQPPVTVYNVLKPDTVTVTASPTAHAKRSISFNETLDHSSIASPSPSVSTPIYSAVVHVPSNGAHPPFATSNPLINSPASYNTSAPASTIGSSSAVSFTA